MRIVVNEGLRSPSRESAESRVGGPSRCRSMLSNTRVKEGMEDRTFSRWTAKREMVSHFGEAGLVGSRRAAEHEESVRSKR